MAEARRQALPSYAQYCLGQNARRRPWQVVLAGWPRPREPGTGTQERMAATTRHTWPYSDPAMWAQPSGFEVLILQRIPRNGDHSHHCVPALELQHDECCQGLDILQ